MELQLFHIREVSKKNEKIEASFKISIAVKPILRKAKIKTLFLFQCILEV